MTRAYPRRLSIATAWSALVIFIGPVPADAFEGGGGSLYFGTGFPNSIDAASNLADDLGVNDETGNYVAGVLGFYQGDRYRIGGAFQANAWGGVNPGQHGAEEDAAGVAAAVGGLYATYTIRRDRTLLNVGGIVGAGRAVLGFSLGDEDVDRDENVATFYLEPHVSAGVAIWRYFGVEFTLGVPVFILAEDLELTHEGRTYSVKSRDMTGVSFSMRLTFGKIADL
jgi:hypothetical protein